MCVYMCVRVRVCVHLVVSRIFLPVLLNVHPILTLAVCACMWYMGVYVCAYVCLCVCLCVVRVCVCVLQFLPHIFAPNYL